MELFLPKSCSLRPLVSVDFSLEFLANSFIAKQAPVNPYYSAQQGASCCGRFGARLYVTSQKE